MQANQHVCECVQGVGGGMCVYGFLLLFGTESTVLRKPFM